MASSFAASLRDLSRRGEEKINGTLKHALSLLQLNSLDELEQSFLATDAFLKPWSVFRDSIFLLQPSAMPKATVIDYSKSGTGITRLDLLWCYTQFDEDSLRYDPRADENDLEYTPDSTLHGAIDKSHWESEDYETHLYAWLLQGFKVGKARNPWGFTYFELKSVCTAWEVVLVPIVDALRASYSPKGRRYYGRLALFVEARCPSRLAFPEDNVGVVDGCLMSPTPFCIVSMPKKSTGSDEGTARKGPTTIGVLTKKHYDQTEKELRDVYPQYGGLVERPKFKQKMEEWLAEQRARADRRKAAELHGEVRSKLPQITTRKEVVPSPEKQTSARGDTSLINGPSKPRPDLHRPPSQQSIYSSIRNSNPFNDEAPETLPVLQTRGVTNASVETRDRQMAAVSRITPTPKVRGLSLADHSVPQQPVSSKKSYGDIRMPSHEGNGYVDEISTPAFHARGRQTNLALESSLSSKLPTRLPGPVRYTGRLRVASRDSESNAQPELVPHLEASQQHLVSVTDDALPEANKKADTEEIESSPIIPSKSPERRNSTRGYVDCARPTQQYANIEIRNISRIVSKENIRAALGSDSRESSAEELVPPLPPQYAAGSTMATSSKGPRLPTYNTHLFPRRNERKGTPVGPWVGGGTKRYDDEGPFEMESFDGSESSNR